jgi:hypothetical protein
MKLLQLLITMKPKKWFHRDLVMESGLTFSTLPLEVFFKISLLVYCATKIALRFADPGG